MSRLWFDARVLSVAAPSSGRRLQVQSADHADVAVPHLWFSGIYQERYYGKALSSLIHSADLPLGLAGSDALLLDLSKHALVSVCFVRPAEMVLRRLLFTLRLSDRNKLSRRRIMLALPAVQK